MNKKKFIFESRRTIIFFCLFTVIAIIVIGIKSCVYEENHIIKTPIKVCLNADTEETFAEFFSDKKGLNKYYNYEKASCNEADFIITSNIGEINTVNEYEIEAYTPLVVGLKKDDNLNNYLKTTTQNGFLTCNGAKKIKNNKDDNITCDFSRIVDVVLDGGDWSDLGGEDKKITIYCPDINTVSGELFYKFLLLTINGGKYPTDNNLEEIEVKAKAFLDSPNTIQTDVASKVSKLGKEVKPYDIYVLFEADLLMSADEEADISITYPECTVIKQIYLQFNNLDIKDGITKAFKGYTHYYTYKFDRVGDIYHFRYNQYRTPIYPDFSNNNNNEPFNVQSGFNYYELNN